MPMIINPMIPPDQAFLCEYVHLEHIGYCMRETTVENIEKAIKDIERNNYYQENLSSLSKYVQYKKLQKEDLTYWIDYLFDVGADHLIAEQYRHMRMD